jgi:hypothetical protein
MNLLEGGDQTVDMRAELEAKWKDKPAEELLKAKVDSDLYIKTLEARTDEIRKDYLKMQEELQNRASLEDLKKQLQELRTQSSEQPTAKIEAAPTLDKNELRSLISNELSAAKQQEREIENFNLVLNKVKEKYGNNYQATLTEQIQELGLTPEKLNERARTEPKLLLKALGLDTQQARETFSPPPKSNQRNDNFAPKGTPKRDYNYYQELKKTNPKLYLDKQIAVQMHNDVLEMGEAAFYGQT